MVEINIVVSQVRVIFSGRVQGVWFRAFTREKAIEAGITGWVKNLPDGSVEALFEGDEETLKNVIEKCRQGPPSARVESIEVTWAQATGAFDTFEIRY